MIGSDEWKPGDWVIDAVGAVWVRADEDGAAQGWPWGYPPETARRTVQGGTFITTPSGAVEESKPARPLTLLIRDGQPANLG